jgi:hypothetical protein
VVGPVLFKVIEDFSSSVDVPFIKGLVLVGSRHGGICGPVWLEVTGGFGRPGSLMGVGRCGRSSALGVRVTHVDIVCQIFGCGILEPDHGRLRLGLRYLRGTRYFSNITRKGGKMVRVHY